jgi:hypothetical protein
MISSKQFMFTHVYDHKWGAKLMQHLWKWLEHSYSHSLISRGAIPKGILVRMLNECVKGVPPFKKLHRKMQRGSEHQEFGKLQFPEHWTRLYQQAVTLWSTTAPPCSNTALGDLYPNHGQATKVTNRPPRDTPYWTQPTFRLSAKRPHSN